MRTKRNNQAIAGMLLSAACLLTLNTASAGMAITSNSTIAAVDDFGGSNGARAEYNGKSTTASQLLDATTGDYYSRIQLDYNQLGNDATISNTFSQRREGGYYDYSVALIDMRFTVDANTTYHLSGAMNATHVSTAGRVYFQAFLLDVTNGYSELAYSEQYSENTVSESFTLGMNGGDAYNDHYGSLTGNLVAGNSYVFYALAQVTAIPTADGGASATGNVTLQLGDGYDGFTPVPEPASIALWSLAGCLGLVIARRRRRVA